MKENKALVMFLFASLFLLVVIVAILTTSFFRLTELQAVERSLATEIEERGGGGEEAVSSQTDENPATVSIEKSGYPAHLHDTDTQLVVDFFERAFTWSGAEEYEEARTYYIEHLGKNNSFVDTYLKKDKVMLDVQGNREDAVSTATKDRGVQDLKVGMDDETVETRENIVKSDKFPTSKIDEVEVVPLRASRDVIYYIAFISYYIGDRDEILSENKVKLEPETAIIEFNIVDIEDGREITDVEAWSEVK